jgi:hypothetical protein
MWGEMFRTVIVFALFTFFGRFIKSVKDTANTFL